MELSEIKSYFEDRGGKQGVKDSDQIWSVLVKLYNSENKGKKGFSKLTFSCGSCRRKAYNWLISQ